jgi:hypothetical protein
MSQFEVFVIMLIGVGIACIIPYLLLSFCIEDNKEG